jgi:hypothetical protein
MTTNPETKPRQGSSFWRARSGYAASCLWYLWCAWFSLQNWKQRACRVILGRSFIRRSLQGRRP